MNIASEASKLLTNKYFLYFIVFISVTNVLGYLVNNKLNAVIFFALVGFLMTNFSKNMAVVLLVSILATNLLMANKNMREGMENPTISTDALKEKAANSTVDPEKLADVDPELGAGLNALKETGNVDAAKAKLNEKNATAEANGDTTRPIRDSNNPDLNQTNEMEAFSAPKGVVHSKGNKAGFHNAKNGSSFKDAAPVNGNSRIDYATTLEDAYDNLDKILGSDGINKLTGDTQKLMLQQQKLFDTMQNMTPMIQQAKDMLSGIDMNQLGGLADMAKGLGSDTK